MLVGLNEGALVGSKVGTGLGDCVGARVVSEIPGFDPCNQQERVTNMRVLDVCGMHDATEYLLQKRHLGV